MNNLIKLSKVGKQIFFPKCNHRFSITNERAGERTNERASEWVREPVGAFVLFIKFPVPEENVVMHTEKYRSNKYIHGSRFARTHTLFRSRDSHCWHCLLSLATVKSRWHWAIRIHKYSSLELTQFSFVWFAFEYIHFSLWHHQRGCEGWRSLCTGGNVRQTGTERSNRRASDLISCVVHIVKQHRTKQNRITVTQSPSAWLFIYFTVGVP